MAQMERREKTALMANRGLLVQTALPRISATMATGTSEVQTPENRLAEQPALRVILDHKDCRVFREYKDRRENEARQVLTAQLDRKDRRE